MPRLNDLLWLGFRFASSRPRKDRTDHNRVELGLAVICIQAVLLLFDIRQLCIAQSEVIWIIQQCIRQAVEALNEFFSCFGALAISPSTRIICPGS